MSSASRLDNLIFRAIGITCSVVLALAVLVAANAPVSDAAKGKKPSAAKKLPKLTKVSPITAVAVGTTLKVNGVNLVKGKKKMIVIFKRSGSKRTFTSRGTATSSTRGSVVVPDVSSDLIKVNPTPQSNVYKLRVVTKFGAAKAWTPLALSPRIDPSAAPIGSIVKSASGDCDSDGMNNGADTDDDNDHLLDPDELAIGTDVCDKDTDDDVLTDFYEYVVAYTFNGGPTLPYPGSTPYPNPLKGGDGGGDYDDDRMTTLQEFEAWQYTGLMSRFYNDAVVDSDGDGRLDPAEDEDNDKLPNHIEFYGFGSTLNWLKTDTDGDGLCDGLDDEDHDGPPTPLAVADCTTTVPNNGPSGTPPTDLADAIPGVVADPDATRIDGDDNRYSNFYEWYHEGADGNFANEAYDDCIPSTYPVSQYCHEGDENGDGGHGWNPFPVIWP